MLHPDVINLRLAMLAKSFGPRYAAASFDSWRFYRDENEMARQRAAITSIRSYIVDLPDRLIDGGGLILSGPVGTGKDHLMASAAIEAVKRGFIVYWRDGMDLFGEVKEFRGPIPGSDVLKKLTAAPILAISDPVPACGSLEARQTNWLNTLIHGRYKRNRPTWVSINANLTSNFDEAIAMLGPQTFDRLRHNATIVRCNWSSYRVTRKSDMPKPEAAPPLAVVSPPEESRELTAEQIVAAEKFSGRLKLHGIGFEPKSPPVVVSLTPEQIEAEKLRQAHIAAERGLA